ncbi:hypothetical protein [Aquabacterium sp.]|uniref:hypothetical protein n=1 Tax=Aquabacterium sp. TaxID=1872578 RepID=UPI0025B7D7B7|nr:hypothetical protein [Aquabacterium sp.]
MSTSPTPEVMHAQHEVAERMAKISNSFAMKADASFLQDVAIRVRIPVSVTADSGHRDRATRYRTGLPTLPNFAK